jgi:hypothetical protein
MTEHELAALLRLAAADVTGPAVPSDRILAAGRRRVRRRRAVEVLATVAVVAAVLVPLGLRQSATLPRRGPAWMRRGSAAPCAPGVGPCRLLPAGPSDGLRARRAG